jgi:hypothetical protein
MKNTTKYFWYGFGTHLLISVIFAWGRVSQAMQTKNKSAAVNAGVGKGSTLSANALNYKV